jgi:3-deoxy-D-manno-oct-2-ulosonic acid (Kdo) hydroxylase
MALLTIPADGLAPGLEQSRAWCGRLEAGDILFFPQTPVPIEASDLAFLLDQQQTGSSLHKNIAYKPRMDKLSGVDTKTADSVAVERLRTIMRRYSEEVTEFLGSFLAPYERRWELDYASFRPQEEQGRDLSLRRRNDLLHTDAFPTRPTHGARILRFFNNIHPTRTRDWVTSDPFGTVVRQFAPAQIAPRPDNAVTHAAKAVGRGIGLGAALPALKRSAYDDFMIRFHNFLKENPEYQAKCPKYEWKFAPGSSWMVYTDTVPHAVLAGQYALEQTFLVAHEALVDKGQAPLTVLEEMAGAPLA